VQSRAAAASLLQWARGRRLPTRELDFSLHGSSQLGPNLASLTASLPELQALTMVGSLGIQPGQLDSLAACSQLRSLYMTDMSHSPPEPPPPFPPLTLSLSRLSLSNSTVNALPPSLCALELRDCLLCRRDCLNAGAFGGRGWAMLGLTARVLGPTSKGERLPALTLPICTTFLLSCADTTPPLSLLPLPLQFLAWSV
jgi:hypothetical protein